MAMNTLQLLLKTLDELKEAELKRFRMYLSERMVEGFEPIPRGKLEHKDTTDIASMMTDAYGEEGRLKLTRTILRMLDLKNPADKLEERLANCKLKENPCETVTSAPQSPSTPQQLNLSDNDLGNSGAEGLSSSKCNTDTLRLADCKLKENPCETVTSVLQSPSTPQKLNFSDNDLGDSEAEGLSSSKCNTDTSSPSDRLISEKSCVFSAPALTPNPSPQKELDLSYNHPGGSGLKLSPASLENPVRKLAILKTDDASVIGTRQHLLKYACDLTLDPNTAHRRLYLSEKNRKVTCVYKEQPYPGHPERFVGECPQVLCREGLTGRCYWEAEWSEGGARISVVYKSIKRKGGCDDVTMGRNAKSWSLLCIPDGYSVWHNKEVTDIPTPFSRSRRIGVYLDWPAGTLSFYNVQLFSVYNSLTHLHTFHSKFTEPLFPGFKIYENASLALFP